MVIAASRRDIVGLRLSAQLLAADSQATSSVVDVAERMLAVQAQDFIGGKWALGVRAPGSAESDVTAALDAGTLVRSWPMRGTLHFVPARELNWMLELTTARLIAGTTTRRKQLELDADTVAQARAVALEVLGGGGELTRAQFMAALESHGIATTGQRGYHLVWHLAQTGVLCWGREVNGQQMLVLLSEWVPAPRLLERDEALGEFVLRYLAGHGPATITDFAWWTKLTLTDAKRGFSVAAAALSELSVDGERYFCVASGEAPGANDALPRHRQRSPVMTLGPFDEYLLGYQDRSLIISADDYQKVVPGKNGMFLPLIVVGGRIVGTWRKPPGKKSTLAVTAQPFTPLSGSATAGFARSVAAYGRFFGRTVDVLTGSDNLKS
ncbi:winged helix DNA-binding domain-containing protein [Leifsonia sp. A12D58]|uniref:winged helix DNA-binding domain-containing protein n=1 Tax=Leifsonia sp. A12D58 TaxID=3397674 RepID=UPI0039E0D7F5